jgi:hypothetical protein
MATIQVRDIPEDTYETIRGRARKAGKSIQSYMRDEIIDMASRPSKADLLRAMDTALERDRGSGVTLESILAAKDAERW